PSLSTSLIQIAVSYGIVNWSPSRWVPSPRRPDHETDGETLLAPPNFLDTKKNDQPGNGISATFQYISGPSVSTQVGCITIRFTISTIRRPRRPPLPLHDERRPVL